MLMSLLPKLVIIFVLWRRKNDCLGSTLSQCAFNHNNLEYMFRKKQVPHMHVHTPWHTHAHHAHTPHLYARVYTCTHCGRKGYLAKFYFDRLNFFNFANKNLWVPIVSNPHGPKKLWVPKSPPLVFDVRVGPHKIREIWCLGGGCIWSLKDTPNWRITIKEVWWEDHLLFWRNGLDTSVLITISFSFLKCF